MKVTIDTKEDKIEDIHKVLSILTHIFQNKNNSISNGESVDTANMMSMFGDDSTQSDKAPDFSSFLNLTKTSSQPPTTKREETPKIEFF